MKPLFVDARPLLGHSVPPNPVKTLAHSRVLILDFGSQYTPVIPRRGRSVRRLRECQVYSEIVRHDITAAEIEELAPKGIILSGGPASVYEKSAPQIDLQIFSLGIPVLGIDRKSGV